jgi:hypothetical protein
MIHKVNISKRKYVVADKHGVRLLTRKRSIILIIEKDKLSSVLKVVSMFNNSSYLSNPAGLKAQGSPSFGNRSTLSSVCRWDSEVKYKRVRTQRPKLLIARSSA